ncbi:MEDS domain-containing protein [Dactylosporangium sp. AC04546]|uniref:MEDS domain-containing protein n=1 Tax=Dactylosporangium sp. AC04546 TaxID=2862460 RepID=UPI001EDF0F0B|nr:MEDS domain-containing protein [Dactylosporangium sp. AC04546]WVK88128.1 MEDS domain-containing protein [Dactylosporangium sp. AC04546]
MTGSVTVDGFAAGDHLCVGYASREQQLGIVRDLALSALGAAERVICYTNQLSSDEVVEALRAADPRTAAARDTGQLVFRAAEETYLITGAFEPDGMIDGWRAEIGETRAAGYPGLCMISDMSWAAGPVAGVSRLAWYEAQANRVYAGGYVRGVCLYDTTIFPPEWLRECGASHPGTILPGDGVLSVQLRLRHTSEPRGLVVTGESDLATGAAFAAVLDGLSADVPGDGPLHVDVSGLAFADVATVAALARAPEVRVIGASAHLAFVLELVAEGRNGGGR